MRELRHAPGAPGAAPDLEALTHQALHEWQAAQANFNAIEGASDPELVDYAIYNLEAARRKYMYLLKQVQRMRAAAPGRGKEGSG